MSSEEYYRPDTPKVIHETIDGEAVMIHMEKGYYYSLDKLGSIIWNMLESGMAVSQIAANLNEHVTGQPGEIEQGLQGFIAELRSEELIVPGKDESNMHTLSDPFETFDQSDQQPKPAFVQPQLHKYTDMEDLLLLDPIHEVDDTGWPALPEEK